MPATSLNDLYLQKIQLLLDAEEQGLQAMPQLARRVQNTELRDALETHRRQTEQHVQRLQRLAQRRKQGPENTPANGCDWLSSHVRVSTCTVSASRFIAERTHHEIAMASVSR
jgi:ferritin-like metal-binding protein YciE